MKLKYFLTCLIFSLSAILFASKIYATERINNYISNITINEDGSVDVIETITVKTEKNIFKHGIYKDFLTDIIPGNSYPQRYINFTASINNSRTQTSTKYVGDNLRVYVGDPDIILEPGIYTFTLSYTILNEIAFYEDHDEIFFNVNGPWNVLTDKISGSIRIPSKFNEKDLKFIGYQGPIGSKNQIKNFNFKNDTYYFYPSAPIEHPTYTLNSNDVVTVGIWFPKDSFNKAAINEEMDKFNPTYAHIIPIILFGFSTFLVFIFFKPNNYKALLNAAPVNFDIPKEYSPADFRFILNKKSDTKLLTAELINLAIKKVIKIEKDPESKNSEDLILTLLDKNFIKLDIEKQIIETLFGSSNIVKTSIKEDQKKILEASNKVMLITISKKFISYKNPINRQLTMFLQYTIATFFILNINNFFPNQNLYVLTPTSIGLVIIAFFYISMIREFNEGGWISIITLIPVFLVVSFFNTVFFPKLPFTAIILFYLSAAPYFIFELKNCFDIYSDEGLKLKMLQLGFLRFVQTQKEYLLAVEKDIPLTFNMYETYLPYAVALDVETQWSKKFNEVLKNLNPVDKLEYERLSNFNVIIIDRSIHNSIDNYYISEGLRQARSSAFSSGGGFSSGGSSGGGGGSAGGGGW